VLEVPFRGVDDVPLLRLELSDYCYKVPGGLVDDGTVRHWGLGLWLPGSGCARQDGLGKGGFPFTAGAMLSRIQKLYVSSVSVGPDVKI
jgi:hypothetical protein